MKVKTIIDEDFVNYRRSSMFIGTSQCNGKCCREAGIPLSVCQNDAWRTSATIDIPNGVIIRRYLQNDITTAICFGGLEPFEQFDELYNFIYVLRNGYKCEDDIVIYTGFNPDEISAEISVLKEFPNIIVKFGRYIPGQQPHYDEVLGVNLASDNQYAEIIS